MNHAPKTEKLNRGGRRGGSATVQAERDDARLTPELRLKTILVPIDFSAASRQALEVAVTLAREFDASLHLLHVAEIGSPAYVIGATDFADMAMIIRRKARAELKALCVGKRLPTLPLKIHVRCGWPFEGGKRTWIEIAQAATELVADLVVIGTEGRTGLKHVWLGSTAERVVQHAPCAVLTVRQPEARASSLRSATFDPTAILVPTDFSDAAAAALPYAAALVKKFGVEVTLIHSLEPWLYASHALAATYDQKIVAACKEKLVALGKSTLPAGCAVKTLVRQGNPGLEVAAAARGLKMDLIVIATHGNTGLKHVLLGSTAERVVRHAPCPVLVVRELEHDFVMKRSENKTTSKP